MTNPQAQPVRNPERMPLATGLLLFVPLALMGNEVGSLLRYPDIGAAVLFPPYAALTAVLLVCGHPRDRIWYLLAGFLAHFVTHWPQWSLSWVLFADVANMARAVVAAVLLRHLLGASTKIDSIRRLLLFVGAAALIAPAVGATIGAANVVLHGASDTYWRPWVGWFVSNALTGLVMLPACLSIFEAAASWRELRFQRNRVIEGLLLGLALGVTCAVAFVGGSGRQHLALPLYLPLVVLIWGGLRFGAGGASLALTIVAFAAIWGVDRGAGPFIAPSPEDNIFALQIFVLFTSLSVLCLAAIATARQNVDHLHRTLLASLQDHVAILDATGIVVEVNDSWRRFNESSKAAPFHRVRVGESYVAVHRAAATQGVLPAAEVLTGVTSVLNRQMRRFQLEYEYFAQGKHESFITTIDALDRPDGGAVVIRTNVTARHLAQLEVEQQQRELSHLARVSVLGQLSGAFAHELNQPLTAILSNAEAARRLLDRHPHDVEELSLIMEDIIADDQRAAAMIQRLRGLLKRGERRFQPIEGRELIEEVLHLARADLITRRIEATVTVAPDLPRFLGDKIQLQQVLLNLILNAGEAMTGTDIARRRLVVTANVEAAGDVHMSVRDFGSGIESSLMDRLFDPFVTTKADGLGLGLSISRTIIAAHGGRLWAENNHDGGATFHCLISAKNSLVDSGPGPDEALSAVRTL